jgi:anthranilate synthase component 1
MPAVALTTRPDLFALHASNPARYPVLLDSTGAEGWDILLACPLQTEYFNWAQFDQFFASLNSQWQSAARPSPAEVAHLPFRGGWFMYLAYELLQVFESSVQPRIDASSDFPLAVLQRIPAAVLHDRTSGVTWLFAEQAEDLSLMQHDLSQIQPPHCRTAKLDTLTEEADVLYLDAVKAAKAYIRAGDVFQVNLSRRWHGRLADQVSPQSVYQALRAHNPAPFSGIAQFGSDHAIVSSSPEYLFRRTGDHISTRPIAGTFARIADQQQDRLQREALRAHPKERAEHVMLVDLERNDLGRVCQPGSVQVDELMGVSTYAHVHHIESTVSGQLSPGVSPYALLRALFPGGTITGCPKVRTMQIIRELESSARGAYTGSMGYLNLDGDMVLNILIRTMMISGSSLTFSAGAGIVADSVPERELAETRAKAKGLLRALGIET